VTETIESMPAQIDQHQLARELVEKARAYAELFDARPLRLTTQVAECLATRLRAPGVGVVLQAEHSCMTLRGVLVAGRRDPAPHPGDAGLTAS
jgi:hypothetical protein